MSTSTGVPLLLLLLLLLLTLDIADAFGEITLGNCPPGDVFFIAVAAVAAVDEFVLVAAAVAAVVAAIDDIFDAVFSAIDLVSGNAIDDLVAGVITPSD